MVREKGGMLSFCSGFIKSGFPDKFSFSEVVKGNRGCKSDEGQVDGDLVVSGLMVLKKTISMSWFNNTSEYSWLDSYAIGVLKVFSSVSSVNNQLMGKGFSFFSSYLGDKSILWRLKLESDKESFINNRFYWDDCFLTMAGWSSSMSPSSRLAWINCVGTPLSCWSLPFFNKVGWILGEPLFLEEDTILRRRFDRGKLMVLIPHDRPCPGMIDVVCVEAKEGGKGKKANKVKLVEQKEDGKNKASPVKVATTNMKCCLENKAIDKHRSNDGMKCRAMLDNSRLFKRNLFLQGKLIIGQKRMGLESNGPAVMGRFLSRIFKCVIVEKALKGFRTLKWTSRKRMSNL
ncbi:hypothetical protein LWI28_009318 [Acer negundo]|uniref:DUF4283 domain-containing protein n=1 Tax=Acer negundo TaxID=4023 RepID=A0AAD5ID13_ACENE|nr:hypothetical protein LWI28_009318 [Acer negundo]